MFKPLAKLLSLISKVSMQGGSPKSTKARVLRMPKELYFALPIQQRCRQCKCSRSASQKSRRTDSTPPHRLCNRRLPVVTGGHIDHSRWPTADLGIALAAALREIGPRTKEDHTTITPFSESYELGPMIFSDDWNGLVKRRKFNLWWSRAAGIRDVD